MDAIQQLEVALLGTPAAKMLDVPLMTTSISALMHTSLLQTISFSYNTGYSFIDMIVAPPQVSIAGVTQSRGSCHHLMWLPARAYHCHQPH